VVAFDPSKREEVLNFLQGLFTGEEAAKESYFWGNLTATLCDLHPGESMECIQGAFEKKLISDVFITLSQVEEAGKRSLEQAQEDLKTWVTARMPTDVHAYISWFAEFNQEDRVEPQPKVKPKKNSGKKKGKKKGKK
jgi:hypothetical protein